MAQSTTMYPFNHTVAQMNNNEPSSLLERRQQTAPFLQQLELPALPPLSQLMTSSDKKKAALNITSSLPVTTPNTRAHVEAIVAMEAAATASMITSTAQPLIQQENTFSTSAGAATVPSQSLLTTSTTNPTNLLYTTAPQNTTTYKTSPVNNLLPPYNQTEETLEQTLAGMTGPGFMDQQHQMFNAAAAVVAGMTDYTIPTSYIDSRQREGSVSSTSSDKVYSFVAIPGTNQLKRPRRRYDEIERLYHCNWAGCTKSYGTLNHLNAHVSMQQHGPKRHPTEFKEMRKEWRRQKKERDSARKQAEQAYRQQQQQQNQIMHSYPLPPAQVPSSSMPTSLYNTAPPQPHQAYGATIGHFY